MIALMQSCYSDYKTDFNYSSVYFARQYPLRLLQIEDDEDLTFNIGVTLAGKYKNSDNEQVEYKIDTTLLAQASVDLNRHLDLKVLPSDYYTVSDDSRIIIKEGKFLGGVDFKLNKEKVLSDPNMMKPYYALPLRIVRATTDSILYGKEYTVYVIQLINQYEGNYWLHGVDYTLNSQLDTISQERYTNKDLVKDRNMRLRTLSPTSLLLPYVGQYNQSSDGKELYTMKMNIRDEDGIVTLSANTTSKITQVVGGGEYDYATKEFFIEYNYVDAVGSTHKVSDTLSFTGLMLKYEEWPDNIEDASSIITLRAKDTFLDPNGIDKRITNYINANSDVGEHFLSESTWTKVIDSLNREVIIPNNYTLLKNESELKTMKEDGVYYLKGDIEVQDNIVVPSNVTLYVEGSVYKEGAFTTDPENPAEQENDTDIIFDLKNSSNVKIIGVNMPKIYSKNGQATAFYASKDDNVLIDGFYITDTWEGVVFRNNVKNSVVKNCYIRHTRKRAVWFLMADKCVAAHNMMDCAGADGFDFDAFTGYSQAYENVVIGAGRWAGFVEEAAHDNYFVNNLGLMDPAGQTDYGTGTWQMGFVDHGTSKKVFDNSGQQTRDNYFIGNVMYQAASYNANGGGNFNAIAGEGGKGHTYFWGNVGHGVIHDTSNPKFWYDAEWKDDVTEAGQKIIDDLKAIFG